MRSFAIWYKKQNRKRCEYEQKRKKHIRHNLNYKWPYQYKCCKKINEAIKADVHINLWEDKICNQDTNLVYIDLGVMIYDIREIDKLFIYCPFEIKKENIGDIGKRIINHQSLVDAIFNADYQTRSGIPRRLIINNRSQDNFTIYSLDMENELELERISQDDENESFGTLLELKLSNIYDGDYGGAVIPPKYYFRIRVSVEMNKLKLIFQEAKNISPFKDAFLITQVIDFRLNNLRSCSHQVRDRFAKGNHFNMRNVHYLLLRKSTDVFIHQGVKVSSRLLERSMWKTYIDGLSENIIAYHFKDKREEDKDGIEDFCILTRFEYQQYNWLRLIAYAYVVVYLGVVSSCIVNFISGDLQINIYLGMCITSAFIVDVLYLKNG